MNHDQVNSKLNWSNKAKPQKLPTATYYPFFLAMGLTFLFWGLISHWLIIVCGLVIIFLALKGWIKALRNEQSTGRIK